MEPVAGNKGLLQRKGESRDRMIHIVEFPEKTNSTLGRGVEKATADTKG